jgi:hypothetical protein
MGWSALLVFLDAKMRMNQVQLRDDSGMTYQWLTFLASISLQGILVVDSFLKMRGAAPWHEYVGYLVHSIYSNTGMRVGIVVAPGASFLNLRYRGVLAILKAVLPSPQFMVWISMGSDIYPRMFSSADFEDGAMLVSADILALLGDASGYCPQQRIVFGGGARLWRYHQTEGITSAMNFDHMMKRIISYIKEDGRYPCISGGRVFEGLLLTDQIGHVSANSFVFMQRGFCVLSKWAMVPDFQDHWTRFVFRMLHNGVVSRL